MLFAIARIFVVAFTVLIVAKSYLSYRSRHESLVMTIFWIVTWLIITAITFFPQLIDLVIDNQRAEGGIGTILGIGLIFIYFVIYRVYVKADRVEKQLAKLVRDMSTDDANQQDKE
ncbi:MAG: DUF2304 domain-containing protein [Patescibacteria group bacterium]